jgi:hypothetical protein
MKNPTKILYLTIGPPENIKNGKFVSTTYTWHKLREKQDLLMMDIKNTKITVRER